MRRLRCGHRLQMGTGPTDQLVVVWWMLGLVEVVAEGNKAGGVVSARRGTANIEEDSRRVRGDGRGAAPGMLSVVPIACRDIHVCNAACVRAAVPSTEQTCASPVGADVVMKVSGIQEGTDAGSTIRWARCVFGYAA